MHRRLNTARPGKEMPQPPGLTKDLMTVQSDDEIAALRAAGEATVTALMAGIRAVKPTNLSTGSPVGPLRTGTTINFEPIASIDGQGFFLEDMLG
jgi:hypothetical protein